MYFRSQKKYGQEVSIHDTIDTDRDGNPLTYMDVMGSDDTIADDIDARIKLNKAAAFITSGLEEREREIVVLRYGLTGNPPMPQREVAKKLGISRSYVLRRRYCKGWERRIPSGAVRAGVGIKILCIIFGASH